MCPFDKELSRFIASLWPAAIQPSYGRYVLAAFKLYFSNRTPVSDCELKSLGGRNDEIKEVLLHLTPLYMFDALDFHRALLIFFSSHRNVRLSLLSKFLSESHVIGTLFN